MTDRATCLCVQEEHPGKQDVGYHTPETYVKTGETVCRICCGSGVSPRAKQDER